MRSSIFALVSCILLGCSSPDRGPALAALTSTATGPAPDYAVAMQALLGFGAAHFNARWPSYLAVFQAYHTGEIIADEAIYRLGAIAQMTTAIDSGAPR